MNKSEYKILLIGTGLLGKSISEKLLKDKFDLSVWNRTKSKYKNLIHKGAKEITDIKKLSNKINTIILVLKDGNTTHSIIEKIENIENKVIIQMGTIGTYHSKKIESLVVSKNAYYLESPVLGSVPESLAGELLIMVGGNKNKFQKYKNLFSTLSKKLIYFDNVQQASACKLALNYQIASLVYNFSITLRYLNERKIDLDLFMDFLRNSALYTPTYDKKLERIKNKDYKNGNFNIDNLSKDINLFTKEINSMKINGKSIELLNQILGQYESLNLNNLDYSSIHELTSRR
tara:strand:- start:3906 stop:4772 length:867 start_codon:yes stop_codon:yes gene_type:complete